MTFLPDIPGPVAILIVAVIIVVALFAKRLQKLETRLQPKITLSVEKKIGSTVQIDAEYKGKKYADDMKLVLHSVEKEDGSLVHKLNESLTRAMTGSEVVPLRPGDPKTFDVAKLDNVMYPNSDLQLAYLKRIGDRGLDKHRVDRMLMPDTYILNVRAVSKRTQPTIEKFRLSYTDDKKLLTLEKIEKEALKWRMADIFRSKKPAKLRS